MENQRARELEVLAESSRLLTSTLDLNEVLDRLAGIARRRLDVDVVRIWLMDESGEFLELRAQQGTQHPDPPGKLSPRESLSGWVFTHVAPLVIEDARNDPRLKNRTWFDAERLVSVLSVPIALDETPLGILACMSRDRRKFTDADVAVAQALTAPAVAAVRNAALYAQAISQLEENQALQRVVSETLSSPVLETALHAVVREMQTLLRSDAAMCSLIDAQSLRMRTVTMAGARTTGIPGYSPGAGQGLASLVLTEKRVMRTDDYLADSRFVRTPAIEAWARAEGLVSLIVAPVIDPAREVIALLWAFNRTPASFTARHEATLTSLAQQAALSIGKARAFEDERRRARQTAALLDIAHACGGTLELTPLLKDIAQRTAAVLGAERCAIFLWRDGHLAPVMAQYADGHEEPELWVKFKALRDQHMEEVPALAEAMRLRRPVTVSRESRVLPSEWFERLGVGGSALVVPLVSNDRVVGTIGLDTSRTRTWHQGQLDLAMTIAAQVALAVDNARLVGDLRHTLEELRAAQETLVRGATLRAVGELAAGAAHHLNNLTAVILGRTQLLLMKKLDAAVTASLKSVERAALDAADTVRRIQGFSRTTQSGGTTQFDLNDVVRETIELTRPRWQNEMMARGITIELEDRLDRIPGVSGHRSEIREAIANLILNATDALPEGGRILITTRAEAGRVLVSVEDSGIGMSSDVRRRAFEPFFTTKGVKRTGLGLAVTYGTVHRHAGEISIESAPGKGTTVTFWIPSEAVSGHVADASADTNRAGSVLVIDDEADVRDLVAEVLASHGHRITTAAGGSEGVERFKEGHYDLVLTDLGLPDLNGWDVARAIKVCRGAIPVLLLTGGQDDLSPAAANLVDGILKKPFGVDQLVAAVTAALK